MFNEIFIRHKDSGGSTYSEMKVPLAYGRILKSFLARLEQQADLNKPIAITLPRMSFEMTSIQYDSSRKLATQTLNIRWNKFKSFMPVPYNIGFELNILAKLNDDALQIIEQILPYFQPSFNLTLDLVSSIGEKRDMPIVLDSMNFQDDYEGDFSTRRALIYTLGFTAKTYLFRPVPSSSSGIIKKVQVDVAADTNTKTSAKRQMRYTVETRSSYSRGPDDDFGFSETTSFFSDGKSYSPTQQKDV